MSRTSHFDVVVVGAGPAGLAAARTASEAGARVLLIDQYPRPGGQIWRHRPGDELPADAREAIAAAAPPAVSVATRATVVDVDGPRQLIVSFAGRVSRISAGAIVLATGALERLLPFPGWTLPGVTGVGGIQALVKSGLSVSGARVVLAGSGPLLLPVAATLSKAGADVLLIGEQASAARLRGFGARALLDPTRALQAVRLRWASRRAGFVTDTWPLRAIGAERIERVVMRIDGSERSFECDWLATNAGLVPRTDLAQLLGCTVDTNGIVVDDDQQSIVPGVFAAGECCGVKGETGAAVEGVIAGIRATGGSVSSSLRRKREQQRRFGQMMQAAFAPRRELLERVTGDTIICRCEDVRRDRLDPSWDQRQAKLWTRVGMGACQGAVCGVACETLFGWSRNTVRPPLDQVAVDSWSRAIREPDPEPGPPEPDERALPA